MSEPVVTINVSNVLCKRWISREAMLHEIYTSKPNFNLCTYSPSEGEHTNLFCGNKTDFSGMMLDDILNYRCDLCKGKQGVGYCTLYADVSTVVTHGGKCPCVKCVANDGTVLPEASLEPGTNTRSVSEPCITISLPSMASLSLSNSSKRYRSQKDALVSDLWLTPEAYLQRVLSHPDKMLCSFSSTLDQPKYNDLLCGRSATHLGPGFWNFRCDKHFLKKSRGIDILMTKLFSHFAADSRTEHIDEEKRIKSFLDEGDIEIHAFSSTGLELHSNKCVLNLLGVNWGISNNLDPNRSAVVKLVDTSYYVFGFLKKTVNSDDEVTNMMLLSLTPVGEFQLIGRRNVFIGDMTEILTILAANSKMNTKE